MSVAQHTHSLCARVGGVYRLRLTIDNLADMAKSSPRKIRLDLLNVGEEPVTLAAQWDYDDQRGDFAALFQHAEQLNTFPEVERMKKNDCVLGPGDGTGLNFVAKLKGIAKFIFNEWSSSTNGNGFA